MQHNIAEKFWYLVSIAGLALVYLLGLSIDIMDIDAAQYASIAREMAEYYVTRQILINKENQKPKDYLYLEK
jgi:hypothetical protein